MRHWLMMAAAAGVFCLPAMAAAPAAQKPTVRSLRCSG